MDYGILSKYNIDYKSGLVRCMNDEPFYESLLTMFLDDTSFCTCMKAFENKDYRALFQSTHELKGVCGNAGLTNLYEAVCPLVELLRSNKGSDAEIAQLFDKVKEMYAYSIEGLELALPQK